MKKILEHKKEIIISLLTGIFLFYVQPLLEYLSGVFVRTFVFLSAKFSDSYYRSIARNDTTVFSEWNSFLLNYMLSVLSIVFIAYLIYKKKELQKRANRNIERIKETKQSIEKIGSDNKGEISKTKEELLIEAEDLEESANQLKESVFKRDNKIIFVVITSIFLIILVFSNFATMTSVSRQNLIFRNDLIKLAPFVKDSIIVRLRSDWARIEDTSSFYKVKHKTDSIKSIYEIK